MKFSKSKPFSDFDSVEESKQKPQTKKRGRPPKNNKPPSTGAKHHIEAALEEVKATLARNSEELNRLEELREQNTALLQQEGILENALKAIEENLTATADV